MGDQAAPAVRRERERRRLPPAPVVREDARAQGAQGLQRAVGNRAVARLLRAPRAELAREISIGAETVTHGSRRVQELFVDAIVPLLERGGYKAYGVRAQLIRFVRIGGTRPAGPPYADLAEFQDEFMSWLGAQNRPVRGGGTTPALKPFSVQAMSRPRWSEGMRRLKGAQAGDDIRHGVRNDTLKKALDVEFAKVPQDARKAHFTAMAHSLGVALRPNAALDQIVEAIYKKLYLHPDNLFAGPGSMNRLIGLSADPVRRLGEGMVADGDVEIEVDKVYEEVMDCVSGAAARAVPDHGERAKLLAGVASTVLEAVKSLAADGGGKVPSEEAGDLVIDIGLNFGFDLIDGRVPEDVDVKDRQARLLKCEEALQRLVAGGGAHGDLLPILKLFLGLA